MVYLKYDIVLYAVYTYQEVSSTAYMLDATIVLYLLCLSVYVMPKCRHYCMYCMFTCYRTVWSGYLLVLSEESISVLSMESAC